MSGLFLSQFYIARLLIYGGVSLLAAPLILIRLDFKGLFGNRPSSTAASSI